MSLICKKTPFLVLWVASVLILVEIVSLVKCCQLVQNLSLDTSYHIRNYLALVILVAIILGILGKVSLFFTYQSSKVGSSL
ncbi:MAG: hypothetical protein SFU27_09695 [Thermonemataceae bacterium]|nr:hypothetical protein [Thermonemataceae bacterium]